MTWLIGYAVFGLVAGAVARLLHPGRDPMNWVWTMALGVAGSEAGGFVARQMGYDPSRGLAAWVAAVAGAVALLALYHALTARQAAAAAPGSVATGDDYKRAVFDDLSRGPNG